MPDLVEFSRISLRIPRKQIHRDLKKNYLPRTKFFKYCKLKRKLEETLFKLAHVSSVVERLLLKTYEYKT